MRKLTLFVVVLLAHQVLCASFVKDIVRNATLWDNVTSKHIKPGTLSGISLNVVDYTGIKNDPDFQAYISALSSAKLDNLTKAEFYAFFINVYNALAVNMIIEHACNEDLFGNCGAIHSIRDIGELFPYHPVWGKPAGIIAGTTWSLDDIENLLRKPNTKYPNITEDPRLYSAIVCASISCPDLRIGAYDPVHLDSQLNASFNLFMSNPKKGMKINQKNKEVILSSIFDWFSSDFTHFFTPVAPTTLDFILTYLNPNNSNYQFLAAHKNGKDVKIGFFDYDWNVNAQKGTVPCTHGSRPCYKLWALLITIVIFAMIVIVILLTVFLMRRKRRLSKGYTQINDE